MGETHPISVSPDLSEEDRVKWLENCLALLWDEVWWHQLPFYRRWFYWLQGFRSPVECFYGYKPVSGPKGFIIEHDKE